MKKISVRTRVTRLNWSWIRSSPPEIVAYPVVCGGAVQPWYLSDFICYFRFINFAWLTKLQYFLRRVIMHETRKVCEHCINSCYADVKSRSSHAFHVKSYTCTRLASTSMHDRKIMHETTTTIGGPPSTKVSSNVLCFQEINHMQYVFCSHTGINV